MYTAVDRGVGVLNLIHPLLYEPDWTAERTRMAALLDAILERGKREARIRDDVRIADTVFAIIRFSRPVAIGLSRPDDREIAHRHLDIYIDGLGVADHTRTPLAEKSTLEQFEPDQ